MSQNTAFRTTATRWDFLEPAMAPELARMKHIKLAPAGSGAYVHYPKGQVVCQKTDGTNEWAKKGTSGYAGPAHILKYPLLINDAGYHQITDSATPILNEPFSEGSVEAYFIGFFKCEEITSAGGTNEVQTLTLDSNVDGGTFTLSMFGHTTAPIAWNATAATIKTAMLAAFPEMVTGDLTASGSAGGPHTFTFTGAYASTNVPLLIINIAGLTDGGVAVSGDTTAIVQTTAGAGLLSGVGRIVQGTSSVGIFELGAATVS